MECKLHGIMCSILPIGRNRIIIWRWLSLRVYYVLVTGLGDLYRSSYFFVKITPTIMKLLLTYFRRYSYV